MEFKQFKTVYDFVKAFPDDQACALYLLESNCNGKPQCLICGHDDVFYIGKKKQFQCKSDNCHGIFSVFKNTIFENTSIPISKIFLAIYLGRTNNGTSSKQLAEDLDITQKSAWRLMKKLKIVKL